MNKEKLYFYLSSDIVFKYIFGTEENKKFTSHFLELYFNLPPNSLKNIIIENSVKLNSQTTKSKRFEMDVLITLPNGNKINLEMQRTLDKISLTKNYAYVCGIVYKNFKSGDKLSKPNKTLQINFIKKSNIGNIEEVNETKSKIINL